MLRGWSHVNVQEMPARGSLALRASRVRTKEGASVAVVGDLLESALSRRAPADTQERNRSALWLDAWSARNGGT